MRLRQALSISIKIALAMDARSSRRASVETDGITALYRFKSNCHLTIRITCAPILLFAGVFSMAYARAGRLLDSVLNRTCDLAFTSWTGGHAELLCAPYRPLRLAAVFAPDSSAGKVLRGQKGIRLADLFDFDFIVTRSRCCAASRD